MKKVKYVVGNDNGNSGHKMIINGELIKAPNVYTKIRKLPNLEELNPRYIAEHIEDNLIVTIESKEINNSAATTFYVGSYAIKSGERLKNIEVGAINSKLDSDVPVINTLAHIAGQAAKQAYKEGQEKVDVEVEMTTALPVNQHNKANASSFANRFMETQHKVTVHLGVNKISVNVKFIYVKVLPEGVPSVFYLESLKKEDIKKVCNLENIAFNDKRILHASIGDGTTEYPLTIGEVFDPNFIKGSNNGAGHAIEEVINTFIAENTLSKYSRQEFSEALINKAHKYHDAATEIIEDALEHQADTILSNIKQEIARANNNIDYVLVYGGGSILMEEYLKAPLQRYCATVNIQLLYISPDYAVDIEALGMNEFCKTDIFKALKEKYIGA